MLIKKEIEGIALLPMYQTHKECSNTLAVDIVKLPRSGRILVADIYETEKKQFLMRFVSDGNNFISCKEWPPKVWVQQNPRKWTGWRTVSDEKTDRLVKKFLDPDDDLWGYNAISTIDYFCKQLNSEKRRKCEDKKWALFREHRAMYPELPANLEDYCEKNIFQHTYVFIEKLDKKKNRYGRCGCCGTRYKVSREVRSGEETTCPKCNRPGKYRGNWLKKDIRETAKICIAENVEQQLLLRWVIINRVFPQGKENSCRYAFTDLAYELYLKKPNGTPRIYFYKDINGYYSCGWWIAPEGNVCADKSYVYTDNLRRVFGEKYYNVDLQKGLEGRSIELRFNSLLTSLKNEPVAEYLFKMGMPLLAEKANELGGLAEHIKPSFGSVLHVDPRLRELYTKHNIDLDEHNAIAAYGGWVTEEDLAGYRALKIDGTHARNAASVLKSMSYHRFVRYFTEQMIARNEKSANAAVSVYEDYLNMSEALKVDMHHKSVRFPADLNAAHDLLLPRFNAVKSKAEDELFQRKVQKLYEKLPATELDIGEYRFILPQKRSELITEGQALSHCVGGDHYYKEHLDGDYMICFVRRKDAPNKPFYTLQFHVPGKRIVQLYGYGNRGATSEIKKAARTFINRITATMQRKTA